jgi:hypothetical protein
MSYDIVTDQSMWVGLAIVAAFAVTAAVFNIHVTLELRKIRRLNRELAQEGWEGF